MKVLVNGIGNIGSSIITLLLEYQKDLEITEIHALKNRPMPWHYSELALLAEKGVKVCTRNNEDNYPNAVDVLPEVDYIFDCTSNGGGISNKIIYDQLPTLKGACAQGSEKNFGVSFLSGINNDIVRNQKYVHVVSCNTHAIGSILGVLSANKFENITDSDFVIVRRSEDIGNHERLVSANVVARHLDQNLGTHHSIDVLDLFETINVKLNVTSSDITTPSQLMHAVRFNVQLKDSISTEEILNRIQAEPLMSNTIKFDSNVIFELGRRYGLNGRIYSHGIIVSNNIISNGKGIKGWAFIPQEGNTLISSIHTFLLQMEHTDTKKVMRQITHDLIKNEW